MIYFTRHTTKNNQTKTHYFCEQCRQYEIEGGYMEPSEFGEKDTFYGDPSDLYCWDCLVDLSEHVDIDNSDDCERSIEYQSLGCGFKSFADPSLR